MPVTPLRERRRAETVHEIKQAALERLGGGELSLRAVARDVGVSVQALYHYFDSRDALLTALIADAYDALAEAVDSAATAAPAHERLVAAGLAYREWAVQHRGAFQLALGAPLPDYEAPQDGPTTAAAGRLGLAFRAAVFDGWRQEELERVPLPDDTAELRRQLQASPWAAAALPPGAFALFATGWSVLHGVVVLETLGHLPLNGDAGPQMCRTACRHYAAHLQAVRDALPALPGGR